MGFLQAPIGVADRIVQRKPLAAKPRSQPYASSTATIVEYTLDVPRVRPVERCSDQHICARDCKFRDICALHRIVRISVG